MGIYDYCGNCYRSGDAGQSDLYVWHLVFGFGSHAALHLVLYRSGRAYAFGSQPSFS